MTLSFSLDGGLKMRLLASSVLLTFVSIQSAGAEILSFTNKSAWESAVGTPYTTIQFNELPGSPFVTTQYQDLGITFTDGTDFIGFSEITFLNDGFGLYGNQDEIAVSFESP